MDSIPTYSRQQILDIVEIQGKECDVNAWSVIGCSPMDSMFFLVLSPACACGMVCRRDSYCKHKDIMAR